MRKSIRNLIGISLVATLVLSITLIGGISISKYVEEEQGTPSSPPKLEFIRKIQITTDEEGGGARTEITYANKRFYVIYRNALGGEKGCFNVKIYDSNFNFLEHKTLVSSGKAGITTDIQATTDGTHIFVAYELVRGRGVREEHSVYIAKYDGNFNLVKGPVEVFTKPRWSWEKVGDEHADDPSPFTDGDFLYIETHLTHSAEADAKWRIRKFDKELNPILIDSQPYVDLYAPFNRNIHGVASEVFVNGKLYIVTQVRLTQHPDVYVLRYTADWKYDNYSLAIAAEEEKPEMRPMGFKYVDGRFYVAYTVFKFERGPSRGGVVYLKVYDSDFNLLQEVRVSDERYYADHPTVEVVKDRVYVAYYQALDARGMSSNSYVNEYKWSK